MNNKHIENAKTAPYNGTYKRRHLLISKSDNERRHPCKSDHRRRMLLSFALLRIRCRQYVTVLPY